MASGNLCRCSAIPFPHDAGTLRACVEHPLAKLGIEMTDEEERDHMAMLNTPRGVLVPLNDNQLRAEIDAIRKRIQAGELHLKARLRELCEELEEV